MQNKVGNSQEKANQKHLIFQDLHSIVVGQDKESLVSKLRQAKRNLNKK